MMRRSTRSSRRTRRTKPGKVRERAVAELNAQQLFASLASEGAVITSLAADSRRCAPGVAFFAYPGEKADGRAHIDDAIRRGGAPVVWGEPGFAWRDAWRIPNAPQRDLKQRAGRLAHEFYGQPSEQLWACGITGTN